MQFAVLARRKTEQFSDAQFAPFLDSESERARALYAEGFIRQIWLRGDEPGAFMMVEAENETEARTSLSTLPLVQAGMLEIASLVPLKPYRGFCPKK